MESGLLGLRAEVQKKRSEASRLGAGGRCVGGERQSRKTTSFLSSNAGVSARGERDKQQLQEETITPDKARSILEEKAALYERLNDGIEVLDDDILNQKFLVNFQKKIVADVLEKKKRSEKERKEEQKKREDANLNDYTATDDKDEWVEYVDAFGRTRECMRKDLPDMLHKDSQLKKNLNHEHQEEEEEEGGEAMRTEVPEGNTDALLEDLHRDALRHRWNQQEAVNAIKKDIHYQDVLFDEARAHGPGFMKFSRDTKRRQEQMEFLKEMRAETKAEEATRAATETKRKTAMKARLEKVRQRKRLKMGLPVKEDDRLKTPPASDDEDEADPTKVEEGKPGGAVASLTHTRTQAGKPKKVREWDLGKEDLKLTLGSTSGIWGAGSSGTQRAGNRSRSPPLSQEEWVKRQRGDRKQEFAPPSSYQAQQRERYSHR